MARGIHRPTKRVVDLKAIRDNLTVEISRLPEATDLFAVVKANGYGHGAVKVAETAKEAGATGFCVALLDEALELREAGLTEPILILGVVSPKYLDLLLTYDLTTTAPSLPWLKEINQLWQASEFTQPLKIHLKIDTGMGRLGLRGSEEIEAALDFLQNISSMYVEGVYTHFAKADAEDTTYFKVQQTRFNEALACFTEKPRYIHTSNSATALWHNHWQSNLIRFGVAMYGLNPSGTELVSPYKLQPALKLVTELVQVKKVPAGERLSYGGDYLTTKDEWIGTLPLGYADGFIRKFTGFNVTVADQTVPIVGRVCMDQCMIRLTSDVPVGTEVVIFSNEDAAVNNLNQAASYIDTINYEVPCLLSERVPIAYVNE